MIRQVEIQMLCSVIAALAGPTLASAASITIQPGNSQLPGTFTSAMHSVEGYLVRQIEVELQPKLSDWEVAVIIDRSLRNIPGVDPKSVSLEGNRVNVMSTLLYDPLDGVLPGGSITFDTGTTAQASMKLLSPDTSRATVAAPGRFEPFLQPFQPAIFTAGIVTDVGELSATVSSQELNFQTDGPIICQALFQRLAPRAPQYGAQINYAGDRLEVYFDPAYTVTQGGIIFGTTSPSQGISGTITTPPALPTRIPGDFNGDDIVDAADYVTWRDGLGSTYTPDDYEVWLSHFGETRGQGSALTTSVSVPEPATIVLFSFALAGSCHRRRTGAWSVPQLASA